MSRRCLQNILASQGYASRDLATQIDQLLAEDDPDKRLSGQVRRTVDAIRNFGNFGAHPITDKTTLQIIPVEPHEAEWCIDVAERLMDHYFEEPARTDAKIEAANLKFRAGGKPEMKR